MVVMFSHHVRSSSCLVIMSSSGHYFQLVAGCYIVIYSVLYYNSVSSLALSASFMKTINGIWGQQVLIIPYTSIT
ncbi:hypothetical protein KUTeg_010960 [Tegillarca granosa]|uniref:Uncharacterized protein n=1 Tax=Tegillarca granosa TaxID=220873 RepID=A0ABQ9F5S6_TEGGR|nr:hypothetical protein KUTeg_010960 [Tegillarca granosa]